MYMYKCCMINEGCMCSLKVMYVDLVYIKYVYFCYKMLNVM